MVGEDLIHIRPSGKLLRRGQMRILQVVPRIREEASGPSYSVPRLCQSLAAQGHEVELVCLDAGRSVPGITVSEFPGRTRMAPLGLSLEFVTQVRSRSRSTDIMHNHGLWSGINMAAGFAVPKRMAKIVLSPRGTLSSYALKHHQYRKALTWPVQRRLLSRTDLFHATGIPEYEAIRATGYRAPVAIVPNGVDLPPERSETFNSRSMRTLLFLGRLHPMKDLETLLMAWRGLELEFKDWRLLIVGKGREPYEGKLRSMARALGLERCEFFGPLYGTEKSSAYWAADLFVLPSKSENFGMVVAEALAHSCPVVVTVGAPWSGLESERCGWWVQRGVDHLAEALAEGMSLPGPRLREMGDRGRSWMARDFSWRTIGAQLSAAYSWIAAGGEGPQLPWIRVD